MGRSGAPGRLRPTIGVPRRRAGGGRTPADLPESVLQVLPGLSQRQSPACGCLLPPSPAAALPKAAGWKTVPAPSPGKILISLPVFRRCGRHSIRQVLHWDNRLFPGNHSDFGMLIGGFRKRLRLPRLLICCLSVLLLAILPVGGRSICIRSHLSNHKYCPWASIFLRPPDLQRGQHRAVLYLSG